MNIKILSGNCSNIPGVLLFAAAALMPLPGCIRLG